MALRPDVVLLSPATRLAGRLEALGIKAVVLDAERIEQVHDKLTVIAALIGRPAAGQRLWADIEAQIAAAVATVPAAVVGRTVYFEVSSEPFAAGPDSFVGEMLRRLGMKNIVPADLGPFPQVNPEFIVRSAPQIIMTVRDELARMSGRPGWAALPALREAHTCGFAPETYRWLVRPGPRLGQAIGQIAQCLQALRRGHPPVIDAVVARRRRLAWGLAVITLMLVLAGLGVGSDGWSLPWAGPQGPDALILGQIRLPRTLGAWLVGALLGLGGAIAQGLFRNPLADPYLLGSASGASLAVVAVMAASALPLSVPLLAVLDASAGLLAGSLMVVAAFVGAIGGVVLTLMLARGAEQSVRLLLAGVVVGVVLGALTELLTVVVPEALRARQAFMLGTTAFMGWPAVGLLLGGVLLTVPASWRVARGLDALTLGEETARSLGVSLRGLRIGLIAALALATALAVSQAGLIPFVGLVAPHLVRRFAAGLHRFVLPASAAMGGALLLAADLLARGLVAPAELPVGILSATLGGSYLLWLLHRRASS